MAKKLPPGVRHRNGKFTYRYSVEVVGKDGKKTRKQKETPAYPTAKAAYDAGILIKAQQLQGVLVDPKNVTILEWAQRWLPDYQIEHDVKDTTIDFRKQMLNRIYKMLGANTRLKDVGKADYQSMLNKIKLQKLSHSLLMGVHSTCKMMFGDAVRKEIISESPTIGAVVPAYRKKTVDIEAEAEFELPKYLEKDELKHFLQIIRFRGKFYEYPLFVTLAYTGMRLGELRALQWSDLDFSNKTIAILKTLYNVHKIEDFEFHTPKTKSSRRTIVVGDTVLSALDSYRNRLEADGRMSSFIFGHPDPKRVGLPIPGPHVRRRMGLLLDFAELPNSLTPHSLRHTHVSLLAENPKVRLEDIQQRLGHKNDRVTREIYLHITKKRQKQMADDFEWVING